MTSTINNDNEIFDKYTKVITADFPRFTVHSSIPTGASLSLVFDHYRLSRIRKDKKRKQINIFFMAGTGMTKSIWLYYIKRLFKYSELNKKNLNWQLVNCVALDLVNHGDSAMENEGLLGWEIDWRDGSHDLIQVAKFLRLKGDNIAIGHSMGGFQVLYGSVVSPLLFKFVISIEPVTHRKMVKTAKGKNEEIFKKLLTSLNKVIRSEFKDEKDFKTYFEKFSFYRNFNKEIFDDFLNSEKVKQGNNSVITVKTSKEQQLLCYLGGSRTFPIGLDILRQITVPVVHIVGGKAKWNSEKDVKEANEAIGKENLDFVVIPEGEHLVIGERPDEVLEIIKDKLNQYIKPISEDDYGFLKDEDFDGKKHQDIFEMNYGLIAKQFFPYEPKL